MAHGSTAHLRAMSRDARRHMRFQALECPRTSLLSLSQPDWALKLAKCRELDAQTARKLGNSSLSEDPGYDELTS